MDIDAIRRHCLSFPHSEEMVQWGSTLCFKVDGKLFAVAALDVGPTRLSFKCSAENFAELCERPDIIPAPYLARAQWVALETLNALPAGELRDLLAEAYRLVWERLPRKRREALAGSRSKSKPATRTKAKTTKKTAKPAHRKTGGLGA